MFNRILTKLFVYIEKILSFKFKFIDNLYSITFKFIFFIFFHKLHNTETNENTSFFSKRYNIIEFDSIREESDFYFSSKLKGESKS